MLRNLIVISPYLFELEPISGFLWRPAEPFSIPWLYCMVEAEVEASATMLNRRSSCSNCRIADSMYGLSSANRVLIGISSSRGREGNEFPYSMSVNGVVGIFSL